MTDNTVEYKSILKISTRLASILLRSIEVAIPNYKLDVIIINI
jgi:hypothetical protein